GIIGSWHPCGSAPVKIKILGPAFRSKLSGRRNRPKTPGEFACCCFVSRYEPAYSIVAARSPDEHFVLHDQRCAGRAIVFIPIGVRNIPDEIAGPGVQTEQMRIVSFHVHAVMPQGNTTADMPGCVIDQSLTG